MKRILIVFSLSFLSSFASFAQEVKDDFQNIDWQEDSSEIVTVADIIEDQQAVTYQKLREEHFDDVWSHRTYLNISSIKAKITPQDKYPTGVGSNYVEEFKSDWGVSLTWGHNYPLHKHPIANVAQINIDYNWMDLNVNHFKIEGDGTGVYDSSKKFDVNTGNPATDPSSSDARFYTPWNLEKYELNYGMSIGPSVTLAPFTYIGVPALHYFRFNIYYHIGYHASLLMMIKNEDADLNPKTTSQEKSFHEKLNDNTKIDWGHGLTTSFGFNVSWKFIGFGIESRKTTVKYSPLVKSEFGGFNWKFKNTINRVYLQFRF